MDALKLYYDREGQTLTVWFDDPIREFIVEEAGEEVLLIKDAAGQVIGFERLNYVPSNVDALHAELIQV